MLKKLIAILFLIFSGISFVYAGEIKFVQVSDTHFTVNSQYTADVLKAAIKDINAQQNISFVVFSGDNIDSSKEENLTGFLKIINKLNVPYYIIIGNHDVFKTNGISKQRYIELIKRHNWFYKPSKPNYVFKGWAKDKNGQ